MKVKVFPRDLLEIKWSSDRAKFDEPGTPPPNCLRCGKPLNKDFYHNKLCRYIPVTICCACGDDEAVRAYSGKMLPFEVLAARLSACLSPCPPPNHAPAKLADSRHLFSA